MMITMRRSYIGGENKIIIIITIITIIIITITIIIITITTC